MLAFHSPFYNTYRPSYSQQRSPYGAFEHLSFVEDFLRGTSYFEEDPIAHAHLARLHDARIKRAYAIRRARGRCARSLAKAVQDASTDETSARLQTDERPSASGVLGSASSSTTYRFRGDSNMSYSTSTKRTRDFKGNVKTYTSDSVNGKVLRKRQQHILPGSKTADVLTRYATNEKDFVDAWKDAHLQSSRDPFASGSALIEGKRLELASMTAKDEVIVDEIREKETAKEAMEDIEWETVDNPEQESKVESTVYVESESRSMNSDKVDGSSLSTMTKSMPDDWMVPVDEVEVK